MLALVPLAACITAPDALTPPVGANFDPGQELIDARPAARELAVAQRMLDAGDYSVAIPRLLHIQSKYPEAEAAIEAKYLLGVTYMQLGGLRDAQENFAAYLTVAPEGKYALASRQYLLGIKDEVDEKYLTVEKVKDLLASAETKAAQAPNDLALQLELADLYWQDAQFHRAGEVYRVILNRYPSLEADMKIRTRMEKTGAGDYAVLTPAEVSNRNADANPILITNTSSFRSGRFDTFPVTTRQRYYNVTGQVVNRGSQAVSGVQIHVTIYGFGSLVYDTQQVSIGHMRPGDKRAFSVRFTNFDDIENVDRYECVATFQ